MLDFLRCRKEIIKEGGKASVMISYFNTQHPPGKETPLNSENPIEVDADIGEKYCFWIWITIHNKIS